jgi:hypothetical protein
MSEDIRSLREELVNSLTTQSILDEYKLYKTKNNKKYSDIIDFLNSIETNKQYYKLSVSYKNVRYKNSLCEDTSVIKIINTKLNQCTNKNVNTIKYDIYELIKNKIHLLPTVIENIIEKSILQTIYIKHYIDILKSLNNEEYIKSTIQKMYDTIFNKQCAKKNDSLYIQLCKVNKHFDIMNGFSILIVHLECEGLINNKINDLIQYIFTILDGSDVIEPYKYISTLYNITEVKNSYMKPYSDKIVNMINTTKCMKSKFKLQDLLDLI